MTERGASAQEQAWRDEFPITRELVYLNNCSLTPLPKRGRERIEQFAREWTELGGRAWYDHWIGEYEALRADLAGILGASLDEVATLPNVSAGLVGIASTFDYTKRPKVVVADLDFPTDGHAFLAVAPRGARVEFVRSPDRVRIPLELFERAVDERTAAVCTGHVYFTTGWIQDVKALAEICHGKGAKLVVDAYQSIGAFPFDVHASGVDYLVGGTLKWLMGGPGMAFLYAQRAVADAARPSAVGWWGVADPFAFDVEHLDPGKGARRFEYGTPAVAAIYAARAGIALLNEIGIATVRERHMSLSQLLVDGARAQGWTVRCPNNANERTSIVTLEHPQPQQAVDALRAQGLICDSRPGLIRLSPHYFNTADEMYRALELLAPLRQGAGPRTTTALATA
ncbi:MAG: aminotransferase class V-fold PLP-dependent enzyme [Candidatus Limnocylindria bacterium]|nr:aminotransferase class V-fold PLP-dependent enzyme [Candidatus Limnocylindria bacterium]